ncbi:hypothetical protein I6F21_34750 [Bradyrhizobium sp. NBAIM03]|uniref:hypothetical protein n=1 Tax=Bradyrhizobium TaxID=374 RepID=UPI0011B26418|nr:MULTISPECIES: hypothetical protein [Bradyrhizobium]MCA1414638.1 hypothetical protein [Bradyrhizobium sp. NBAIM20]MCA1465746.1 hypothetical protein [Bradyrhizobium sp. NBAIM18]MCA1530381.1 hypothetical protein [Bradyrhizobium yuanmingense]MCA1537678.1 hypothetical protein [Bradyrhizobium sp. NBAIM03]
MLREHHEPSKVSSRSAELVRVDAADEGAMIEPIQARHDRNWIIDNRNALEVGDGFFVRSLPEKGIHHFGLADGADQKIYVAPRHHHHVAAGFEPRVLPDGTHIPVGVAQSTLAVRVNQPAFIGFLEVQRKQPVEG